MSASFVEVRLTSAQVRATKAYQNGSVGISGLIPAKGCTWLALPSKVDCDRAIAIVKGMGMEVTGAVLDN